MALADALPTDTILAAIEVELQLATDAFDPGLYGGMYEMVAYHHGWKGDNPQGRGKRVRPLLTALACAAAGGTWQTAIPAAAGVELVHNFSLLHDDIEDQSDSRRGRATVWKRWGLAQGLNAGDAIFVLARLAVYRLLGLGVPALTALEVQRRLDQACLELTKGQYLDIDFERRDTIAESEYWAMIEGKTAALLSAATSIGALVAGAVDDVVQAYAEYGRHLGLAFQVQDDMLGIWGDPAVTGKPSGDDLRAHKHTLPVLIGLGISPPFAASWEARPTDEATIASMASLLEDAGARRACEEKAGEHTRLALAALAKAGPCEPAATQLQRLSLSLLGRQR
jgi:geranylgeranyl diphosphate synthase type I